MKIILTGANGLIGSEVLKQAIKNHYIHHIFVFVRKPLSPELATHKKVTQLFHEDFEKWPEDMFEELRGVGGCIWCIGGALASFKNLEEAQKVNISLPLAAAEAFVANLAQHVTPPISSLGKPLPMPPFRFIYLSCAGAEQNQFASLWVQADTRKMKGAAEKGLIDLADSEAYKGSFEPFALRLGKVLPGGQTVGNMLTEAVSSSISAERVARCAISTVLSGRPEFTVEQGKRIVENAQVLGDDWADINTFTI